MDNQGSFWVQGGLPVSQRSPFGDIGLVLHKEDPMGMLDIYIYIYIYI